MADIESNIKISIDTSSALENIKNLQRQISAFQSSMASAGASAASSAAQMQQNLINSVNATGKFSAGITTIKTTTESFTTALEKNKLSMGEYFRYSIASTKSFGNVFKTEFDTINRVATERVKDLQTQYIKLGRDANGAMKAISVRPLTLDMDNLSTKQAIVSQRQQLLNQLLKQGSTNLLNFGKNTQWAGRQLMVGFTIPLMAAGAAATKAYMQIEQAAVDIRKVYGDLNTSTAETNKAVSQIEQLAASYTKYGVAVADTMKMAAEAAAMGKTGTDLLTQIDQATKLSVLGGVDQSKALQTTISLTNAFGITTDQLSNKINFLNAVENQTVLNIQDMTDAIPKAAPVVKQLGGNVEDLAYFLTAMKEGGISATQGANALKSSLGSLINPTAAASKFLAGFGINVKGIVESDKGNLKKTVLDFANSLNTLDPLNRARAIEMMFGKFQFARISTLFQNITKDGSQASKVMDLASMSSIQLAAVSRKELDKVQSSPMYKFQKAMADLQLKLAPIGEAFLKTVTPIIDKVSGFLDGFNKMSDGAKQFILGLTVVVAGLGPVLLMTFGLVANGVANITKGFATLKSFFNRTTNDTTTLGEQTSFMTTEQIKAHAVAASLDQIHQKLSQTFTAETTAVAEYTAALERAVAIQSAFSGPTIPRTARNLPKFATGGMISGPGTGTSDSIIARVSNGEAIIPAASVARHPDVVNALISGNIPGFATGKRGKRINATDAIELGHLEDSAKETFDEAANKVLQTAERLGKEALDATTKRIEELREKAVSKGIDLNSKKFGAYNENVIEQPQFLNNAGNTPQSVSQIKKFYDERGGSAFSNLARHLQEGGVSSEKIAKVLDTATQQLQQSLAAMPKNAKITNEEFQKLANSILDQSTAFDTETAQIRQQTKENFYTLQIPGVDGSGGTRAGFLGKAYKGKQAKNAQIANEVNGSPVYEQRATYQSENIQKAAEILRKAGAESEVALNEIVRALTNTKTQTQEYQKVLERLDIEVTRVTGKQSNLATSEMLANKFNDALASEAQTASPSKRTKKIAKDTVDGYAIGLNQGTDKVVAATKKVTQSQTNYAVQALLNQKKFYEAQNLDTAGIDQQIEALKQEANARKQAIAATEAQTAANNISAASTNLSTAATLKAKFASKVEGALTTGANKLSSMGGGKLTGLGMAASMTTFALAGTGGTVGNIANQILPIVNILSIAGPLLKGVLPKLVEFIPVIARFAGPVGIAITAITALVGAVQWVTNETNKEAKAKLAASQQSASVQKASSGSISDIGKLLGITASNATGFDAAVNAHNTNAKNIGQANDIQTLLSNPDFKNNTYIKKITDKATTNQDARATLLQQANQLTAAGATTGVVDSYLKAAQAASGRNLGLDANSINFATKAGMANLGSTTKLQISDIQQAYRSSYNANKQSYDSIRQGKLLLASGKDAFGRPLTAQARATLTSNINLNQNSINNSLEGRTFNNLAATAKTGIATNISSMVAQLGKGQIKFKAFTKDINDYAKAIGNSKEASALLDTQLGKFGPGAASASANLKDVNDKLLLMAYLSSHTDAENTQIIADLNSGNTATQNAAKKKLGTESTVVSGATKTYGGTVGGTTGPKPSDLLTQANKDLATAQLVGNMTKQGLGKTLIDALSTADAATQKYYGTLKNGIFILNAHGKALRAAFNAKTIQDFVNTFKEKVKDTQTQVKLQNALVVSGLSIADAQTLAADQSAKDAYAAAQNADERQKILGILKQQLDLQEQLKTAEQKAIEAQQKLVDLLQAQRDLAANQADIPLKQAQVNEYQDALSLIGIQENEINQTYSDRIKALDEIQKANDAINQSKQDQLTIADALTKGDISAAAKAAQDARANASKIAFDNQRTALDTSKQNQLDALTVDVNGKLMTRKQIQTEIDAIQKSIYETQLKVLDPLDLEIAKQTQILTILQDQQKIKDLSGNSNNSAPEPAYLTAAGQARIAGNASLANAMPIMLANPGAYDWSKLGVGTLMYRSTGGIIPAYFANGGYARGTDTVPSMLTPGEYVISQPAVKSFGLDNLKAINNGTYDGNSVYNYSINVSAGGNATADDIARIVMTKIKQVDSQRIGGTRL